MNIKRRKDKMKVVTIAQLKGGVGKSSLSLILAKVLAFMGFRILVIDNDIQNSTSFALLPDGEDSEDEHNLYRVYADENLRSQIIPIAPNLDLIQSSYELVKVERMENKNLLRQLLVSVEDDYDFCICDTAPSLNAITYNAISAADVVILPTDFESKFSAKTTLFVYDYLTQAVFPDRKLNLSILYNKRKPKDSSKTPEFEARYTRNLPADCLFWSSHIPPTNQILGVVEGDFKMEKVEKLSILYPAILKFIEELLEFFPDADSAQELTNA